MSISQIINSKISHLVINNNNFEFQISTEISLLSEQTLSNPDLYKKKNIESLTTNPESYKREILNPINFANELRIALMNYVITVAVDRVEVIKNSSFIIDELLQQRIELLSVEITDNSLIWDIWETDDYELSGYIDVSSKEDGFNVLSEMIIFDDKRIKMIPRILIITLAKGQSLKCNVILNKGFGETAKKYSPVSTIGYQIIDNTTVIMKPKSKGKIPIYFILFYALTYLENKYSLFNYSIEGGKFTKNIDDNIIIVE